MLTVKKTKLLLVAVCCLGRSFGQNDSIFNGETLSSFSLYSTAAAKNIHLPADNAVKRLSLFIFLSPECPLSQSYLPLLNNLSEQYGSRIGFYGIVPGKAYSSSEVNEFASVYKIRFPLLIDTTNSLSNYLGATVTPEIIFLNEQDQLLYKGAVDDLMSDLGKRRLKATKEYLKDALSLSLQNKTPVIKRTKAVGCRINDY